jgi:hypothetical protein
MATLPCTDPQSWKKSQAASDSQFHKLLGGSDYTLHHPNLPGETTSPNALHSFNSHGAGAIQVNNIGDGNQFPWATFYAPVYFNDHCGKHEYHTS